MVAKKKAAPVELENAPGYYWDEEKQQQRSLPKTTPQWGAAAQDDDIPAFLKKDDPRQTDLEEAIAETKPENPEPVATSTVEHDPETGEIVDAQQYVPAPEPGSPEHTEEVPGPSPAQGGDGRPLSSDDNKPRHVFDEIAGNVAGEQLRAFVERIERLEEEKKTIADDIREVYAECKGTGFDSATVRRLIALRKMDPDQRQENEALLDVYKSAIGME